MPKFTINSIWFNINPFCNFITINRFTIRRRCYSQRKRKKVGLLLYDPDSVLSPWELLVFVVTRPLFVPVLLLILRGLRVQVQLLQLLPAECGVIRPWGGAGLLLLPVDMSGAPGPRP